VYTNTSSKIKGVFLSRGDRFRFVQASTRQLFYGRSQQFCSKPTFSKHFTLWHGLFSWNYLDIWDSAMFGLTRLRHCSACRAPRSSQMGCRCTHSPRARAATRGSAIPHPFHPHHECFGRIVSQSRGVVASPSSGCLGYHASCIPVRQ
jgi:hypothetical protein